VVLINNIYNYIRY